MTGRTLRFAAVVAALVLVCSSAGAREEPERPAPPHRPRIGLALAGGGARGAAHIGVLEVMEELKIPVDCVAGTSMGAIVGGLYSAGMSPAQMRAAMDRIDWEDLLSARLKRKQVAFRRKEDDNLDLLPFELGVGRNGISGKAGILGGGKIDFVLQSLTLNTAGTRDFDQLRIPFRAVAADLATGEPVILDHGNLADAMRASMSIPGVFTPMRLDGRVLVDGGISMNLPVDVAFDMCADRVIVIDVGTPPRSDVSDLGTLGVLSQVLSVLSEQSVVEQRGHIPPGSLLITPDLSGVTVKDFAKIDEAIEIGVKAARQHEAELRAFAVSEPEFQAYLQRQRRGGEGGIIPQTRVDEIEVQVQARDGSVRQSPRLASRIRTKAGEPIDPAVLYRDLIRISQSGEYEAVNFSVIPREGRNDLVIAAREKSWGPGYASVGLSAESDFQGDSSFRALVEYRRPKLNRLNAELKSFVLAGDESGFNAEFYQPLGYSGFWFVAPRAGMIWKTDATYLDNGDLEVVRTRERQVGLDMGIQLGNYGEVRAGVLRGHLDVGPVTETTFGPLDRSIGGMRFKATLDQIDSVFFPTHGNYSELRMFFSREGLGADDEYETADFRTVQAWTAWRGTVVGALQLGTDLGSDVPIYDEYRLGGFLRLSGLRRGKLQGDVVGLATLVNYWRIGSLASFARRYIGVSVEAGNTWDSVSDASWGDLNYGGSLFFGLDTKFLPIYIGGGLAEGGHGSLFLFIGRPF